MLQIFCDGPYEQSPHGFMYQGRVRHGFRDWGDELWVPEGSLGRVTIRGRKTITYQQLVKEYQRTIGKARELFQSRRGTTQTARRIVNTNRAARLYLQLLEEFLRLRMKGAALPEYLPPWLDDFKEYFVDSDGELKRRVSREEFRRANETAARVRREFLT